MLLDLIHISVPENIQGKSFAGFFRSGDTSPHRNTVFAMMHGINAWTESRCVRKQKYKLIRNFSPTRWMVPPVKMGGPNVQEERPVCELHDFEIDPDSYAVL